MSANITRHSDKFGTAPQLSPSDMAEVAAMGFKTVVNNRPDGEGGADQPTSEMMEAAAHAAGLNYDSLPVISGQITEQQAQKCAEIITNHTAPLPPFFSGAGAVCVKGKGRERNRRQYLP